MKWKMQESCSSSTKKGVKFNEQYDHRFGIFSSAMLEKKCLQDEPK
jgi:hypothetical protein